MSRIDNSIWQMTIPMPTGQLQAYRSTKIGTRAIQINAPENYRMRTLFLIRSIC